MNIFGKKNEESTSIYEKLGIDVFNAVEGLAHIVSYDAYTTVKNKTADSISVLDLDLRERDYKIELVTTDIEGLCCTILYNEDHNNIHVLFKGTTDLDSALRSAEAGGAGNETFDLEKQKILDAIDRKIKYHVNKRGTKANLIFSGHSLGGADTQNAAAATIIALNEGKIAVNDIDHIVMNYANSAGITNHVANKANAALAELHYKNNINIYMNVIMVTGDELQTTGETTLFAKTSAKFVKTSLLVVDNKNEELHKGKLTNNLLNVAGKIRNIVKAHTYLLNNFSPKNLKLYRNYHSKNDAIMIENLLNKKSTVDNNMGTKLSKKSFLPFAKKSNVAYKNFKYKPVDIAQEKKSTDEKPTTFKKMFKKIIKTFIPISRVKKLSTHASNKSKHERNNNSEI